MQEASWDDFPGDDWEEVDECGMCRSAPCRCDDDYERWKESQLDDRD